uniref:Uncharacterized protein n=1 Tax=viral metagenome TaxID=1070528 RepID=A0A6M3XUU0_9ZZZZ
MARDLGRDVDIGIPPTETLKVDVVASAPITAALKEQVAVKIDETNMYLETSKRIQEFILGQEVDEGEE